MSRDSESKALIGQALLVIANINDYVEHREVSESHCLRRLSASLEIVANSLTCHQEKELEGAEVQQDKEEGHESCS